MERQPRIDVSKSSPFEIEDQHETIVAEHVEDLVPENLDFLKFLGIRSESFRFSMTPHRTSLYRLQHPVERALNGVGLPQSLSDALLLTNWIVGLLKERPDDVRQPPP